MKDKKFWLGAGAVFVVLSILEYIVNMRIMSGDYEATSTLWRPMGEMKFWLFYVVYVFISFFFTLIFSKGYEGGGVAEGARYGFYVGMMMAVPMAYGTYAAMPVPYSFALKWFLSGLVEYIVVGIVLAAVYGKQAMVTKAQSPPAA